MTDTMIDTMAYTMTDRNTNKDRHNEKDITIFQTAFHVSIAKFVKTNTNTIHKIASINIFNSNLSLI